MKLADHSNICDKIQEMKKTLSGLTFKIIEECQKAKQFKFDYDTLFATEANKFKKTNHLLSRRRNIQDRVINKGSFTPSSKVFASNSPFDITPNLRSKFSPATRNGKMKSQIDVQKVSFISKKSSESLRMIALGDEAISESKLQPCLLQLPTSSKISKISSFSKQVTEMSKVYGWHAGYALDTVEELYPQDICHSIPSPMISIPEDNNSLSEGSALLKMSVAQSKPDSQPFTDLMARSSLQRHIGNLEQPISPVNTHTRIVTQSSFGDYVMQEQLNMLKTSSKTIPIRSELSLILHDITPLAKEVNSQALGLQGEKLNGKQPVEIFPKPKFRASNTFEGMCGFNPVDEEMSESDDKEELTIDTDDIDRMHEISHMLASSNGSDVTLDKKIEKNFFQQLEDDCKMRKPNLSRVPKLKTLHLDFIGEVNSTGKEPSIAEEDEENDQSVKVDLYDIKRCRDLFSKVAE